MSYTAKHFVRIAGRMYTPGEIIDNPIPDDKLQRLLRLGAVATRATADEAVDATLTEPRDVLKDDTGENREIPDGGETDEDDSDEDDSDEDAEVPEIDAMDGVVPAEARTETALPAKPARSRMSGGGRKRT